MSVKTTPVQYESNGRKFKTETEAKRFDAICTAREELECAQRKFQRVLAESAKTADGEPFRFGVFCDYWHVFKPWNTMPRLEKFCYMCLSWSVKEDGETIQIREDENADPHKRRYIDIAELYASETVGRKALIVAQEEWLEERMEDIAKAKDEYQDFKATE